MNALSAWDAFSEEEFISGGQFIDMLTVCANAAQPQATAVASWLSRCPPVEGTGKQLYTTVRRGTFFAFASALASVGAPEQEPLPVLLLRCIDQVFSMDAPPPWISPGVKAEEGAVAALTKLRLPSDPSAVTELSAAVIASFGSSSSGISEWRAAIGLETDTDDQLLMAAAYPLPLARCAGRFTLWLNTSVGVEDAIAGRFILSYVALPTADEAAHHVSPALGGTHPQVLHAVLLYHDGAWRVVLDGLSDLEGLTELLPLLCDSAILEALPAYPTISDLIAARGSEWITPMAAWDVNAVTVLASMELEDLPQPLSTPHEAPVTATADLTLTPALITPTPDSRSMLLSVLHRIQMQRRQRERLDAQQPLMGGLNSSDGDAEEVDRFATFSTRSHPISRALHQRGGGTHDAGDDRSRTATYAPATAAAAAGMMPLNSAGVQLDSDEDSDDMKEAIRRSLSEVSTSAGGAATSALAPAPAGESAFEDDSSTAARPPSVPMGSRRAQHTHSSGARVRAREPSRDADAERLPSTISPASRARATDDAEEAVMSSDAPPTPATSSAATASILHSETEPSVTNALQPPVSDPVVHQAVARGDVTPSAEPTVPTPPSTDSSEAATRLRETRVLQKAEATEAHVTAQADAPLKFYKGGQFSPSGRRAPAGSPAPAYYSSSATSSGRFYSTRQFMPGGGRAPRGGAFGGPVYVGARSPSIPAPPDAPSAASEPKAEDLSSSFRAREAAEPAEALARGAGAAVQLRSASASSSRKKSSSGDEAPPTPRTSSSSKPKAMASQESVRRPDVGGAQSSEGASKSKKKDSESRDTGMMLGAAVDPLRSPATLRGAVAAPAPPPTAGTSWYSSLTDMLGLNTMSSAAAPPERAPAVAHVPVVGATRPVEMSRAARSRVPAAPAVPQLTGSLPSPAMYAPPPPAAMPASLPAVAAPDPASAAPPPPLQGHYVLVSNTPQDELATLQQAERIERAQLVRAAVAATLADPEVAERLQQISAALAPTLPATSAPTAASEDDSYAVVPTPQNIAGLANVYESLISQAGAAGDVATMPHARYADMFDSTAAPVISMTRNASLASSPTDPSSVAPAYDGTLAYDSLLAGSAAASGEVRYAGLADAARPPEYAGLVAALPLYAGLPDAHVPEYASMVASPGTVYTGMADTSSSTAYVGMATPPVAYTSMPTPRSDMVTRYDDALSSSAPTVTTTPPPMARPGRVMTYIPPEVFPEDAARFSVYAPLVVAPTLSFVMTVYMYVREQEKEVRMIATAGGSTDRGTAMHDFPVRRGELVTFGLFLPTGVLQMDTGPFLSAVASGASGSGAVQQLKYIRAKRAAGRRVGMSLRAPTAAPPTNEHDSAALLRTHADATAHVLWTGVPEYVDFHVRCTAEAAEGVHACKIKAIAGDRVLTFQCTVAVAPLSRVHAMNAHAAATAARIQHGEADATAAAWELGTRGLLVTPTERSAGTPRMLSHAHSDDSSMSERALSCISEADDSFLLESTALSHDFCGAAAQLKGGAHGVLELALLHGDRVVVVKRPPMDAHSAGDALLRAFRHEMRAQAALGQHPNLVQMLGATTSDPRELALVMEYLPLGSLRSRLDALRASSSRVLVWDAAAQHVRSVCARSSVHATRLRTSDGCYSMSSYLSFIETSGKQHLQLQDPVVAAHLARDMAAGLSAMHSAGYVHRDIAARNVLLSMQMGAADVALGAKMCDMGMAVRLGVSTPSPASPHELPPVMPTLGSHPSSSSSMVEMDGYGTAPWQAPETLRWKIVSQAADVYSYGCLLWEMCDPQHREPWSWLRDPSHDVLPALFPPSRGAGAHAAGLTAFIDDRMQAQCLPGLLDVMRACLRYDVAWDELHVGDVASALTRGRSLSSTRSTSDSMSPLISPVAGGCDRPSMAQVCAALDAALMAGGAPATTRER